MPFARHIYEYDTVVVGGTVSALLYSYLSGFPCIFVNPRPPFRFDEAGPLTGFQKIGMNTRNQRRLFEHLLPVLSLGGQLLASGAATSLTVSDDILKATTSRSRLAQYRFKKLIVMDDSDVTGLPPVSHQVIGRSRVIDWLHCRSGMEHDLDTLVTDDNFINKVFFYPSDRFGTQTTSRIRKDVVTISYLEPSELQDFNFSETMARHKTTQIMKDAGIKGARNGRDTKNPNLYRYYAVKLESAERVIEPDVRNSYQDDDRFEFVDKSLDEILSQMPSTPLPYTLKISENFLDF